MLREDRMGCPQPGLAQPTPHTLGPCQISAAAVWALLMHVDSVPPSFCFSLSLRAGSALGQAKMPPGIDLN